MNPIYKFDLIANGISRSAHPIYGDGEEINYKRESGEQFLRGSLNGELTFNGDDYGFIVGQAFDTKFVVVISVSYNAGSSWTECWTGVFWKTDCKFNEDDKTVIVTPALNDVYLDVLNGIDKEYNLIDLAPEVEQVKLDKRPMIQVYIPGQTVIGCFLANLGWEQECEAVDDETILEGDFHFAKAKVQREMRLSGTTTPSLPDVFTGVAPNSEIGSYEYSSGGYKVSVLYSAPRLTYEISRISDGVVLWRYEAINVPPPSYPATVTLSPVSGTGASGTVSMDVRDISVFMRCVCDVEDVDGSPTFAITSDDPVANNRNYRRVIPYNFPSSIYFGTELTSTPTQYGIYQPGQYYAKPNVSTEAYPVSRSAWGRLSVWYLFLSSGLFPEDSARSPIVLRDAYPLASVISVLLGQIAPSVTHAETAEYSQFLYGTNPLTGVKTIPVICPKSNLIYSGYDQPARKAPITLRAVLDMLRDCFRCYWYIDSGNRLIVEHVRYFDNGLSYSGNPGVGADLTERIVTRNGKPWAYARNAYAYDKVDMPARYQFGWMDDQTTLFDGKPIDMVSGYVQENRIENIDVKQFSSDVDYILLNPSDISKDGFVLMLCEEGVIVTRKWINIIDNPITLTPQESHEYLTIIDLAPYRGKTLRISSIASNIVVGPGESTDVVIMMRGTDDSIIQLVSVLRPQNPKSDDEFSVPAAAATLQCFSYGTYTLRVGLLQYLQESTERDILVLPYVNRPDGGVNHNLQNGYASFDYLQQFYLYDLPGWRYKIGNVQGTALGVKKLKTQDLQYPQVETPDLQRLIRTELGAGKIRDLFVNLSSRGAKVTLEYDTEQ